MKLSPIRTRPGLSDKWTPEVQCHSSSVVQAAVLTQLQLQVTTGGYGTLWHPNVSRELVGKVLTEAAVLERV